MTLQELLELLRAFIERLWWWRQPDVRLLPMASEDWKRRVLLCLERYPTMWAPGFKEHVIRLFSGDQAYIRKWRKKRWEYYAWVGVIDRKGKKHEPHPYWRNTAWLFGMLGAKACELRLGSCTHTPSQLHHIPEWYEVTLGVEILYPEGIQRVCWECHHQVQPEKERNTQIYVMIERSVAQERRIAEMDQRIDRVECFAKRMDQRKDAALNGYEAKEPRSDR